jgi:hypothetical protein
MEIFHDLCMPKRQIAWNIHWFKVSISYEGKSNHFSHITRLNQFLFVVFTYRQFKDRFISS